MTNLFLDTNVVMDMLIQRKPFFIEAANIFALAAKGKVRLFVSPMSYATAAYLIGKQDETIVKSSLLNLRRLSEVTRADESTIDASLQSEFSDFEDALQYFSAATEKIDYIITRNKQDFTCSQIPVKTPAEFLKINS